MSKSLFEKSIGNNVILVSETTFQTGSKNKRFITIIVILVLIIVLLILIKISSTSKNFTSPEFLPIPSSIPITPTLTMSNLKLSETVRVKTVFDGDTLELTDDRRVRLIGIDAPEVSHQNQKQQCFAQQSKEILTSLLISQEIEMEKDNTDTDKYGRLLRYVYNDGVFINEFLLRQGYTKTLIIPPDTKYSPLFKSAQLEAKENSRGLWKSCSLDFNYLNN